MELISSAQIKLFKGDSFSVIVEHVNYYKEVKDGGVGCREGSNNKIILSTKYWRNQK